MAKSEEMSVPTGSDHGCCMCRCCLKRYKSQNKASIRYEAFQTDTDKSTKQNNKAEASDGGWHLDDDDPDIDDNQDWDTTGAGREKHGRKLNVTEDREKNINPDRYSTNNVKRKVFTIDSMAWAYCLRNKHFEKEANALLQKGKLPDKATLDMICSKYTRKFHIVQSICISISEFLQQKSDRIKVVWAAYRYTKRNEPEYGNGIVFVIQTKNVENIEIGCDFEVYFRSVQETDEKCKQENIRICENERTCFQPNDIKNRLKQCVAKNADTLMKKHSNLTRVTMSLVKSRNIRSEHKLECVPCIAFYVQIKGLIPIHEEPFTENVMEFPVDVREGVFRLYGKPEDLHERLKHGCMFDTGYGTKMGTIGPFIYIEGDSNYYCLTSSHVVLNEAQIRRVINTGVVHYGKSGIDCYQPPYSVSYHKDGQSYPFGRIETAVYKEGGQNQAGMEIALLRINDKRQPVDCTFPDTLVFSSFFGEFPPTLSCNKVCDISDIRDGMEVFKYGGASGFTKGYVRFAGSSVKTSTFTYSQGFELILHNQIEIQCHEEFGQSGDSGALVLININNELISLGIFEGCIGERQDKCYIVTPLTDIVRALCATVADRNPEYLHKFGQDGMEIEVSDILPFAIRIRPLVGNMNDTRPVAETVADFVAAKAEIEENILFHTGHKINSVKEELNCKILQMNSNMEKLFKEQNTRQDQLFQGLLAQLQTSVTPKSNEQN